MNYAKLRQHLHLNADELAALQQRRLQLLLQHSYDHVPYYRELFDEAHIKPEDIRTPNDLIQLPITNRETLQSQPLERLLSEGLDPGQLRHYRTSGSTGRPLSIYQSKHEVRFRQALQGRSWLAMGLSPGEGMLRIGPMAEGERIRHDQGPFSTISINPMLPLNEQIELIRDCGRQVWWVYPGFLKNIIDALDDASARAIAPRMLLIGAEPLHDELRRELVALWPQVDIRVVYGSLEFGRIAWECEAHDGLHYSADALHIETIADTPERPPVSVITSLYAHAMPLLRYRLGDLCELDTAPCRCGIGLPRLKNLIGRLDDQLRLPGGGLLGPEMVLVVMRRRAGIRQYRVIQRSLEELHIEIVPEDGTSHHDFASLRRDMQALLAAEGAASIQVSITQVSTIPTQGIKNRSVVSLLE